MRGGREPVHTRTDTESSTGNKNWGGFWCTARTECSGSSYNTFATTGTIQPFTQINAWSDFGAAVVHHLQLTQVDPVTHNGIARDGYVFTGWDKDVTKPITGDTVYTARYRPAVYIFRNSIKTAAILRYCHY